MITFLLLIFLYGQSLLLAMEKRVETKQRSKVFFGSRWIVNTGDRGRTIIIFMGEEASIIKGKGLNFNEVLKEYLKKNPTQRKFIYCKGTANLLSINKIENLGEGENAIDIIDPVRLWGKMIVGLYPYLEKLEQSKNPKAVPKDLIQYLETDRIETENYNQAHTPKIQSLFEKEVNEMVQKMESLTSSLVKINILFLLEKRRNDYLIHIIEKQKSKLNSVSEKQNKLELEALKILFSDLFKVCQDFYVCTLFNKVYQELEKNNDTPIIIYSSDLFLFSRLNELFVAVKGGVIQSSELQEVVSNKFVTSDQNYLKFAQSKDYLGISAGNMKRESYKNLSEDEIKTLFGQKVDSQSVIKIEQKRPLFERMKRTMGSLVSWRNLGIAAAAAAAIGASAYFLSRSKNLAQSK